MCFLHGINRADVQRSLAGKHLLLAENTAAGIQINTTMIMLHASCMMPVEAYPRTEI